MIFEDIVEYNDSTKDSLDIELSESYQIENILHEGVFKINSDFLSNGVYNFIKHDDKKFLIESYKESNLLLIQLLNFVKNKVTRMHNLTINILKEFNKDQKLMEIIINLLNNKDNTDIILTNEIEDYDYNIPADISYYKYFDNFILTIKDEYLNGISNKLIEKNRTKFDQTYFDKLRGKLIDASSIKLEDFPEMLFKYFRSGNLEPKYLNIDKKEILKVIYEFKNINPIISMLNNEYANINKFYTNIELMIKDQSNLFSGIKTEVKPQEKNNNEMMAKYSNINRDADKIYIDYVNMRNRHFNMMISVYNIYFVEKLLAVKQMYKSYYNRCALYYSKLKYRSEL